MPKKQSQKGTGGMGEHRYRKSKGGYQQAHIGGPQALRHHKAHARDDAHIYINRLCAVGTRIYSAWVSPSWNYETMPQSYGDPQATRIEIWRVCEGGVDVDFLIVRATNTLMRWRDLVRRIGFDSDTFNPDDDPGDVLPPRFRGRRFDDLTPLEKGDVWIWRWQQGITAK